MSRRSSKSALQAKTLAKSFRVDRPKHFRLEDVDPSHTCGLDIDKDEAKSILARDIEVMKELQERLYAEHRWAVLIILQGMDAAGKDSTIKHIMSGINPQGVAVHSFKAPSAEELGHDFLWRNVVRLPERGRIGIFNRSYYEEVLAVRVHADLLAAEELPPTLVGKRIWHERYEDIVAFERHLLRNGTVILKFHLRISPHEQKRRLLARLDEPSKHWKFSPRDIAERSLWPQYMQAYQDMIRHTSTGDAPWYVVPADHKWFAQLAVAATVVHALERLDPQFPSLDEARLAEMKAARKALREEKG
jgi:PPK2 family polyphosphate:nucleotide phosphotransferase